MGAEELEVEREWKRNGVTAVGESESRSDGDRWRSPRWGRQPARRGRTYQRPAASLSGRRLARWHLVLGACINAGPSDRGVNVKLSTYMMTVCCCSC
ncbi:hypothetical protein GQ55_7G268600 [Panicum hallii var. hallii]|uniref:Uncharacterized protein n=1 Tax=Panicum hallii var. hallii TaxID=1504633 RepID=A0A2T7CZE0_9POAL|nr:hypothetical protein GQ55_7G268600 [Panicum hallii var. hallii]